MLLKFKILKIFFIIFFITNANAITFNNIEVSEQYGRLTSHEQACSIARDNLFDKARRMASGYETISSESTNICRFSDQESKCDLFSNSFRSIAKVQIVDYGYFYILILFNAFFLNKLASLIYLLTISVDL